MDLNCNYVVGRADGCRMVKIGAEFSKEERNVSRWLVEDLLLSSRTNQRKRNLKH